MTDLAVATMINYSERIEQAVAAQEALALLFVTFGRAATETAVLRS